MKNAFINRYIKGMAASFAMMPFHFFAQLLGIQTYTCTGGMQTFTVPPCVTSISVEARGAQGGGFTANYFGKGGVVSGVMTVTPGQVFYLFVGGQNTLALGGYNGGGNAGVALNGIAAGGGGASDVRYGGMTLNNRIMVAGGGGGGVVASGFTVTGGNGSGGSLCATPNGRGGGGGEGSVYGGGGSCAGGSAPFFGTGGAGGGLNSGGGTSGNGFGMNGLAGTLGMGGDGGGSPGFERAGGGGGGYYGGAGGHCGPPPAVNACTLNSGAGGGGSSYVNPSLFSNIYMPLCGDFQNPAFTDNLGDGKIIISFDYFSLPSPLSLSSASVCTGNTVTLSASGLSTYTWLPVGNFTGSSNASITTTPSVSTQYTLVGTNSLGCVFGATTSVFVQTSLPNLGIIANPAFSVCSGASLTLTALNASTYTWSGGVQNGVGFVPNASGNYTVIGSNSCGNAHGVAYVTVGSLPLNVVANSTLHCSGNNLVISAYPPTYSFTWQPGNIVGTNSISIMPSVAMVYSVYASSGVCLGNWIYNVNPVPSPSIAIAASQASICSGQSVNLSASGAQTYLWNAAIGFPGSSNASVQVSPVSTSIYTVNGSSSGCTTTNTVQVVVFPAQSLSVTANPNLVCAAQAITLSALGANTYTWVNGSPSASQIVFPTVNTTYTVNGTYAAGPQGNQISCNNTAQVQVMVNPSPIVSIGANKTEICKQDAGLTLTANGANTYTWSTGQNTTSVFVSPIVNTTYTLSGSNAFGCQATASIQILVFPCVGLNENGLVGVERIQLFPNPNTGTFKITSEDVVEYKIYNEQGQCVSKAVLNSENAFEAEIQDLLPGVYFVRVDRGLNSKVFKVIVLAQE
ncbi:MAG: T9SS type A sorting domain-containing protein [Bacteroidia bacterium]|nr:T9SS type A sorting domain-containing protein [Bacteroidia bacterium]